MGLDMFLKRRTYIGGHYDHRKVSGPKVEITVRDRKYAFDTSKIEGIDEQVGYWRKDNQIHKWFVSNVQNGEDDCREYEVSKEQLRELLALCRKVIDTAVTKTGKALASTSYIGGVRHDNYVDADIITNADEVAELLPTESGFFFGGTGYDQWYLDGVNGTIKMLEALDLDTDDYDVSYHYQASW